MQITDQSHNYTDRDLLAFLGQQESQNISWGSDFTADLVDHFKNGGNLTGATLPWGDTHDMLRFREGEITIHAGMNGHMKSMITGQILEWIALTQKVGVMSFEMPVVDTMMRMCKQAAGSPQPSEDYIRDWSQWTDDRICFYDKLDTTPSGRVLAALMYMAKDLGCKHILIDSLTKCGLPYGERGAEKDFIDALCATAKAFKIHIHLVCHVRKPQNAGQEYIPNKFDVRGAGELTDLVHNVCIHWNNKKKARLIQQQDAGVRLNDTDAQYVKNAHSQKLIVEKQRNGEFEGAIGLHFDNSLQFYRQKKSHLFI